MKSANSSSVLGLQAHALGCYGCDIFGPSDTDAHTGNWFGFYVVADVVIASITDTVDTGVTASTVTTTSTIEAGTYIPAAGIFTAITLTSGTVVMYRQSA